MESRKLCALSCSTNENSTPINKRCEELKTAALSLLEHKIQKITFSSFGDQKMTKQVIQKYNILLINLQILKSSRNSSHLKVASIIPYQGFFYS